MIAVMDRSILWEGDKLFLLVENFLFLKIRF